MPRSFLLQKTEKTLFSDEIILAFCSESPYNSYDKERSVDPMTDVSKLSGVCASIFMSGSAVLSAVSFG